MFEILVRSQFNAAHRIAGYGGKCEALHGHNWLVEVRVSSAEVGKEGMVMDFAKLKKMLNQVLDILDHKFINDLPQFKEINPTSENIAQFIFEKLEVSLKDKPATLTSISVWETDTSCATYSP